MNIFFVSGREDNLLHLSEEESWHCAKVLRMRAGDQVNLLDGKGTHYIGNLISVHEKKCVAEISESIRVDRRKVNLHLAIAPTKNMDRMEWFSEKATEMGIEEISFIRCKNSERKEINTERIRKIVTGAAKQSGQAYLPIIHDCVSLPEFFKLHQSSSAKKIIAHCAPDTKKIFLNQIESRNVIVVIGPEGDFAEPEIDVAIKNDYTPVSLGESRLRTETAAVYVAAFFR